jgi:segregation and condensation protein A
MTMTTLHNYTVALPHFEGPLELLLNLIERQELEITDLSISQVTGDYLATITALEKAHSDDLRWFLEVGSKLIAYKTRAIRRDSSSEVETAESLADLAEELERYQGWRNLAETLGAQFGAALPVRSAQTTKQQLAPKNLSLASPSSWRNILTQKPKQIAPKHHVTITRSDIQHTMQRLLGRITQKQAFTHTLSTQDRRTKTLSLLALLELIKQDLVRLVFEQEEAYVQAI